MKSSEQTFLNDVSGHKLTIFHDDGVRRHLRFKQPDSGNMYFDIITWPWHLCYCGDMGTYVFSRIEDMLRFFRLTDGPIRFDAHHWAEKCQAHDRSGVEEYSADIARKALGEYLDDCEASPEVRQAVIDAELDSYADDGESAFRSRVFEFDHDGFQVDLSEHNLREYTYRFIWCCYALVWGIRQYDAEAKNR